MKKLAKFLILVCITLIAGVSPGHAADKAPCSYELFLNDFESSMSDMSYKSNCSLTDSPVDSESHGRVAQMVFSSSSDNYCGPDYETVSDRFESGELKKAVATVDILFEDYVKGNLRLLSSEQVGSAKNGMYALYYNTDGTFTNPTYTFTNQENWSKYSKYKLNTWYKFRIELDLEAQTFSMWINGDEITADTKIITNAKTDMIDFLHMRVNLNKASADEDAKNIYIDNFGYYIPLSYIYTEPVIELTAGSSELSVTAAAPGESKAALVAALYEGDTLAEVTVHDAEQFDGIAIADYICSFAKGKKYKFFLMEDTECLRPLCKAKEYYSFTDMDYELLKDKWREFLVGGEVDLTSEPVAARVTAIYNNAKNLPGTMNKSADATSLWGAAYTASSHLGTEYAKIYRMALAYGTKGQALYQDESLYNDIIYALDWMYENRYGQAEIDGTGWRSVRKYNWWDWFVSAPGYIMETLMILHEEVTDEQIDKYFSLYTYLKTIMRTDLSSDANVNSWAYNAYGAAVLQKDEATIRMLTDAYDVLFEITTSGTGMYEDFSYIKHNMMAYTGMYGTGALLDRVVKVMSITGNTPYAIPQVKTHMYEKWIFNAFEPLMYNAGIMSMMRGRGIDGGNEYGDGLTVLESILNMIDVVSDEDALSFKMLIKRHFKGDRLTYAYKNLTLPHIIKLESIVNDPALPEPEPYLLTKVYYHMDRAVHHKENWTFGLAMSSERVANYESINGVNKNGWYTGDGMTYLYVSPDQYNAAYFEYADPYKRPGTTVDSQERQEVSVAYGQEYFSSKDFVGGASMDDSYAVVAMDLESFHNDTLKGTTDTGHGGDQPLHDCDLTAKKSWYLFDSEVVCLGTDINATADYEVYTTVENRKITAQELYIDGTAIEYGTQGTTSDPAWAHIGDTCGYYFPNGGELKYRQIKNSSEFFEMWLSHGNAPSGADYAYAILPKKTAEETEAYAKNPGFEILSNTPAVQAVYQKELDITGYTFWSAGSFDGIAVSAPAAVLKKSTAEGMELTFSDPTHKLDNITITLDGEYTPAEHDEQLTVSVSGGKTVISGDLSAVTGKTLKVKLTK